MRGLLATLFFPALAGALYVGISRFTLLEPPRWPVILSVPLWIFLLLVWGIFYRPTRSLCARFLDRTLDLDERVSTYLEVEGRQRIGELPPGDLSSRLAADAAMAVDTRDYLLPSRLGVRLKRTYTAAAVLGVAALLAAILLPTTMDAVKAERHSLNNAVAQQVAKIEALRADLVARPGLGDTLKASLDARLKQLEADLRSGQKDRADALASIADVEEQVRSLSPSSSSSDFSDLLAAAQVVQAGTAQNTDWDPFLSTEKDDLGKAAEALDHAQTYVNQFSTAQSRGMASSLERASTLSEAKSAELAAHLTEAANGLRAKDQAKSRQELDAAKQIFRSAQGEQQAAAAVENTLSQLADSRQSIAKAGSTTTKKQQVGFRRTDKAAAGVAQTPGAGNSAQADAATPGAGQNAPGSGNNSLGQGIGQNQPALGNTGGTGGPTTNGPTAGQQSSGSGSGGQSAPGAGKATGNSSSAQAGQPGGSGTGGGGSQQGAISGPVRVGGASASSGGAAGNGIGQSTTGQGSGQSALPEERLYVPGADETQATGGAGQASPPAQDDGVQGRVGQGSAAGNHASDPGLGQSANVRTPYTQVLGQYSQQATQALDRAYVPPDAKDYVRDYFSSLGK